MSMVGVGEEQHFQECPCALLKGGQWYLLSASLALLIPCSSTCSSCLWDEGYMPGTRGGGQGAQVFSFLLCFYGSALDEEWIYKLPNGTFSMLVGEPRAPRSLWCVCGSGEVLKNFRTTPCPVLRYVFVALHPPIHGAGNSNPMAFALGNAALIVPSCTSQNRQSWVWLFPRIEDFPVAWVSIQSYWSPPLAGPTRTGTLSAAAGAVV